MKEPSGLDIVKIRDTNEIYKIAFQYISKNSANILLPLFSIAIPLMVLTEIIAIALVQGYNPFNRLVALKRSLDPKPFLIVIFLFVLYILGVTLYNYFINNCLLRSEKIAKSETTPEERPFMDTFKNYMVNFVILYFIYYIVANVSDHFYLQFLWSLERDPVQGVIGYIWYLVVNELPWLVLMPPILFFCFSASYLSYRDQIGSSDALIRIWNLVKEKMPKLWYNSIMVSGVYFGLMLALKIFLWYVWGAIGFFSEDFMSFSILLNTVEIVFTLLAVIHLHVSMVLLYGSVEDEAHGQFIKRKVEEL